MCYFHQRVRLLEEKAARLTDELDVARRLEPAVSSDAVEQLERKLRRAEDELAAGEVLRDNLRTDREKVSTNFNSALLSSTVSETCLF